MARTSAALLLFRRSGRRLEVLLVHPGGPFWARRDAGSWSLPKGEHDEHEDALAAARREFEEELGRPPPAADWIELGTIRQKGGKVVAAWAGEGDLDTMTVRSGTFEMVWPPRSGRVQAFPEVDRAAWFTIPEAGLKLNQAQREFLARLEARLQS